MPEALRRGMGAAAPLGAVLAAGGFLAAALAMAGHDPGRALAALGRGALGSPDAVLSVTLVRSVPLVLTGLAVALAFRAGVWNIGAEGQLYAGAVAGVWVGLSVGGWPAWLAVPAVLAAGVAAGLAWATVPALMKVRLGVGEVITTLLMNFVAIHLASWVVHGPLREARGVFPQTDPVVETARLPLLVDGSRLHAGLVLALAVAGALWAFLRWTRHGFALRAVGASPVAARIAGRIPSGRVVLGALLASGAIAGLAGAVEIAGTTHALYDGLSPGWGYTAIAVALLARLNPLAVVAVAIFFGALQGGAGAMQRAAGVPAAWVGVVEAVVILAVLGLDRMASVRTEAPRG